MTEVKILTILCLAEIFFIWPDVAKQQKIYRVYSDLKVSMMILSDCSSLKNTTSLSFQHMHFITFDPRLFHSCAA